MSLWQKKIRFRMRRTLRRRSLLGGATPDIFTAIYQGNLWGNPESRSGWGSTLQGPNGTEKISQAIGRIVQDYGIATIVDVPCGDMNWFPTAAAPGVAYLGVDIVPELIERNTARYGSKHVTFACQDLTAWVPPPADLIIVRDLLIHLSNTQARACIRNVASSGARYLLISNYSGIRRNGDTFTGGLRLHNLNRPPFSEFGFAESEVLAIADGDGNQGRQMLLCDVSRLATIGPPG